MKTENIFLTATYSKTISDNIKTVATCSEIKTESNFPAATSYDANSKPVKTAAASSKNKRHNDICTTEPVKSPGHIIKSDAESFIVVQTDVCNTQTKKIYEQKRNESLKKSSGYVKTEKKTQKHNKNMAHYSANDILRSLNDKKWLNVRT